MQNRPSLLDELRTQYEAARQSVPDHAEVEGFQEIDARMRKAFRWLEKAVAYLDGIKPPIDHRFDLGHGFVFESPKFRHGYIGQHTSRIVGFPVLDEINIYYEIAAAKPLTIEVAPGGVSLVEKTLEAVTLQFSSHKVEAADGTVRKCAFTVPPAIPAGHEPRRRTGVDGSMRRGYRLPARAVLPGSAGCLTAAAGSPAGERLRLPRHRRHRGAAGVGGGAGPG